MRQALTVLIVLGIFLPVARAQSLRVDVTGRLETTLLGPSSSDLMHVDVAAKIYFRTDLPPTGQSGDQTDFAISYVELDMTTLGRGRVEHFVFSGDTGFVGRISNNPTADTVGNGPAFDFVFTINNVGQLGGAATFFLRIGQPNGFPGPNPSSLPDSAASYANSDNDAILTAGVSGIQFVNASSIWTSSNDTFSRGPFSFRFTVADPPSPPATEPCSQADFAEPFGQLDFSDVVAFLVRFGAGCS